MFKVELTFDRSLAVFLPREMRQTGTALRVLNEKTAVKDVIEACGVPHPEVDLIVSQPGSSIAQAVEFTWPVREPAVLQVYAVPAPGDVLPTAPRLQVRTWDRFVADGHLGKLARNLRLLGIDTAYERDADDRRLLDIMVSEDRALLTRDRRLLMHSIVTHGYCPRSSDAEEQTREVLRRFDLSQSSGQFVPYRRCLRCNEPVDSVAKSDVLGALSNEPLTLRYYNEFRRCPRCGRIYWQGTHFERLAARVVRLLGG